MDILELLNAYPMNVSYSNMFRRVSPMAHKGSPRYNLMINRAAQSKKKSPKALLAKKSNSQGNGSIKL
jgi:hypothetical protein